MGFNESVQTGYKFLKIFEFSYPLRSQLFPLYAQTLGLKTISNIYQILTSSDLSFSLCRHLISLSRQRLRTKMDKDTTVWQLFSNIIKQLVQKDMDNTLLTGNTFSNTVSFVSFKESLLSFSETRDGLIHKCFCSGLVAE